MKISKYILGVAMMASAALVAKADDCYIHLLVTPVEQGEEVPDATNNALMNRLTNAVTATGVTADENFGQFFITGRFSHIYQDVVPGPPMQHALHTELTLYVGDLINQKVYATESFELRGVGTSEQRAFINAMGGINARNAAFKAFVDKAQKKIIAYYDSNYPQILAEASRAAAGHRYDEALYFATQIPVCCKGWPEAEKAILSYFQSYIDQQGQQMLMAAMGEWAADPTATGAAKAWRYLLLIDPASSSYPAAEKLAKEMAAVTMDDKMFETREKYRDTVDLERRRIDAARQVGVAYGNGQQPTTTHITWLH